MSDFGSTVLDLVASYIFFVLLIHAKYHTKKLKLEFTINQFKRLKTL